MLSVLLLLAGCGERKAERFQALPFPDVTVPGVMDDPQSRADYLAEHFWDRFTGAEWVYPCDTNMVNGVLKADVEGRFANWVGVLERVSLKVARKSVVKLFEKAYGIEKKDTSSNVFETVTSLVEKYLYDPNSPFRNEELYLPYVDRLARCDVVDPLLRSRYAREASMCSLNRIGEQAADFRFMDKIGRIHHLYEISSEWILLFFSNPGCEACMNIIQFLSESPAVAAMMAAGRLAVANVYIDEDIDAWRSYMPIYPESWYNGFDPDMVIRNDVLYDVRAIPSLYILDRDKKVVMKDAPEPKVFGFLENLSGVGH